jgi:hypothetical protein
MAKTASAEKSAAPAPDAYTGMLILSLVALLAGGVLVFLDYNRHLPKEPPKVDRSYQPTFPGQDGDTKKAPDDGQQQK